MCGVLAAAEIADRLSDGAAAVLSRAPGPLAEIEGWLLLASARELLRIDRTARPTEPQRELLIALLPQVWPETWRNSRVAFAAGLRSEA
jgi:hypothetical protein